MVGVDQVPLASAVTVCGVSFIVTVMVALGLAVPERVGLSPLYHHSGYW